MWTSSRACLRGATLPERDASNHGPHRLARHILSQNLRETGDELLHPPYLIRGSQFVPAKSRIFLNEPHSSIQLFLKGINRTQLLMGIVKALELCQARLEPSSINLRSSSFGCAMLDSK